MACRGTACVVRHVSVAGPVRTGRAGGAAATRARIRTTAQGWVAARDVVRRRPRHDRGDGRQLLTDVGASDLVDVGLGLATISMITGVGVGSALVRWAVHSPRVTVMRNAAPTAQEDYDVDRVRVATTVIA